MDPNTISQLRIKYEKEIEFWIYTQYLFFTQWFSLKKYANDKGILIIGDMPIYVAADSADVWTMSHLFDMDDDKNMINVAGCPPDAFSETGQLWGNPLYLWEKHKETNYAWWMERIKVHKERFDIIRLDHFRAFEAYWEIPGDADTAVHGKWVKGPGYDIFEAIKNQLGDVPMIAEDLGFLTEAVFDLRKQTGYPGMKVLQFAFSVDHDSIYLPHNIEENSVIYTGTHDNETTAEWAENVDHAEELKKAVIYLNLSKEENIHWGFIRGAWGTRSILAIAPMQDFLGLGKEARMNIPSTTDGNWTWRCHYSDFNDDLAIKIRKTTKLYGRLIR